MGINDIIPIIKYCTFINTIRFISIRQEAEINILDYFIYSFVLSGLLLIRRAIRFYYFIII